MEDLIAERGYHPTTDRDDHDAYHWINTCNRNSQYHDNLPTATDMFPFGDTADKICPHTTQSIKEYPSIWIRFRMTTILLGHHPIV
ncbi:unnamed protein product [Aspergillus oryzae]|uniref:Unnamed protein product n=2 Tax=Aspergillus oryzae TaxID=5062 RepID=A0AAN5C1J7_ASPOZ|nr:unnamed protein product [Aspergillus oryzae]GMF86725.1 unnamed protein product [Aspergillus oryzae]GMG14867.1 unnamed protein product [Aspergillus oryzae]GMG35435.1 unnamed protein product [Aspergillus oryzae]GMG45070.1 unnamed protein product [Aspergillus oryzae var. brunneus]